MKTKLLMAASAVVMGAAGLAGTFLPQELLRALHLPASDVPALLVQLHAALLLGFAMLNWMAKESLIGGVYNRPLAIGNLVHFVVGAITLVKFISGGAGPLFVIATVIYAAFAVGFGILVFGVRLPQKP
jgi:hypothetical protein